MASSTPLSLPRDSRTKVLVPCCHPATSGLARSNTRTITPSPAFQVHGTLWRDCACDVGSSLDKRRQRTCYFGAGEGISTRAAQAAAEADQRGAN
eukprot:757736-Hanusia_phi.AAC.2